jgi:hypothetical protein
MRRIALAAALGALALAALRKPSAPQAAVELACLPPGGTMYVPHRDGFRQVITRQSWITDETDRWAHADDWLAGEYECVLMFRAPNGKLYETRDVVDWVVALGEVCPAAFTRLRLALSDYAHDQEARPEARN